MPSNQSTFFFLFSIVLSLYHIRSFSLDRSPWVLNVSLSYLLVSCWGLHLEHYRTIITHCYYYDFFLWSCVRGWKKERDERGESKVFVERKALGLGFLNRWSDDISLPVVISSVSTIDRRENRRRAFLQLRGVGGSEIDDDKGGEGRRRRHTHTHVYSIFIYVHTHTHATSSCRGQHCCLGCHRDEWSQLGLFETAGDCLGWSEREGSSSKCIECHSRCFAW